MKMNDLKFKIVLLTIFILLITQTTSATNVEEVSAPYEVIGAINATDVPYISVNSMTNPDILYYNIEDGSGGENISFPFYPNLTIPEDKFTYSTTSWEDPDDGWNIVAWLGEEYFVVENSSGKWIITKLLLHEDDTDEYVLRVGESLSLPEGYVITAEKIDVYGNIAWLFLSKDGKEIYNQAVRILESDFGSRYFVYETDLGAADHTQVFNFTLDTVFVKNNVNMVKIKNIDLLSTETIELYNGDRTLLENYVIVTSPWEIVVKNYLDLALQSDNANPIVGDSYSILINNDEDSTALARVLNEPGTYEIMGATNLFSGNYISANSTINPSILYYDTHESAGEESLDSLVNSNLTISSNNLTYFTQKWYSLDGKEYVGVAGKKYLVIENNVTHWKIAEKLLDENKHDSHTLMVGQNLVLGEGFVLTLLEADVDGSNARLAFTQNGSELKNQVMPIASNFAYETDLGGTVPTEILNITVVTVFTNMNTNYVKINNTDLISSHVLDIVNGDTNLFPNYSIITDLSGFAIRNDNTIVLNPGGLTDVISELFSIRVSTDGNIVAFVRTITVPEISIISLPYCQAEIGESVTVPVYIDVAESEGIVFASVNLTYDNSIVNVTSVTNSDFYDITFDVNNFEGFTLITGNQSGITGVGPGNIKLADITFQTVGKYGSEISELEFNDVILESSENNIVYKVPFKLINGTFKKIFAGIIETVPVPVPYEIIGATNASNVSGISATSLNNPSILYYDLDEMVGAETIDFMLDPDLTIGLGNLTYSTNAWIDYEGNNFIRWFGEKYLIIENTSNEWIISDLLVSESENDDHLMRAGEILTLPEGWAITTLEIDVKRQEAWMSLSKDGEEVSNRVVKEYDPDDSSTGYFVYMDDLGAVSGDTEIMNFTFDALYFGMGTNLVKINNIDLISTDTIQFITGDSTTITGHTIGTSTSGISIHNNNKISLSIDGITNIFGGLFSIRVNNDGNSVGLVKTLTESGIYEITGKIGATGTSLLATSENCPGILYYDLEARVGGESLVLPVYANLTIPANELIYLTSSWVDTGTGLTYTGWQGKKYLVINSGSSGWNITEKLIDEDENDDHLLRVGESLELDEGYAITVLEIDVNMTEARLSLSKDGIEINNSVVAEGLNYVLESDLGGSGNTEVLNLTIDAVFVGNTTDLVKINDIDMISTEVLELKNADMGMFNNYIVQTTMSQVSITNIDDITLSGGNITYIIDPLFSIRVDEMGNQAALVKLIQVGDTTTASPSSTRQLTVKTTPEPQDDEVGLALILVLVGFCGIVILGYLKKDMILKWIKERLH
ncbi:MAG: hypothetical protein MIO93_09955 [ANME-2 cluster archaeon]|nr:hypothetical protein [ANME-2 cluster archaeon]